jgi:hypothetical protein
MLETCLNPIKRATRQSILAKIVRYISPVDVEKMKFDWFVFDLLGKLLELVQQIVVKPSIDIVLCCQFDLVDFLQRPTVERICGISEWPDAFCSAFRPILRLTRIKGRI